MKHESMVFSMKKWMNLYMHSSMQGVISFARQNNVSMSQMGAMFHLHRHVQSSVSDLGEELGISSAAVSQMLERLVRQGLVLRTEAVEDRRVKVIKLSEKGSQMVADGIQARLVWLEQLSTWLTPEETQKAVEGLNVLIEKGTLMENSIKEKRESKACGD